MAKAAAVSEGGGEAEPASIAVDTVFRRLHAKCETKANMIGDRNNLVSALDFYCVQNNGLFCTYRMLEPKTAAGWEEEREPVGVAVVPDVDGKVPEFTLLTPVTIDDVLGASGPSISEVLGLERTRLRVVASGVVATDGRRFAPAE